MTHPAKMEVTAVLLIAVPALPSGKGNSVKKVVSKIDHWYFSFLTCYTVNWCTDSYSVWCSHSIKTIYVKSVRILGHQQLFTSEVNLPIILYDAWVTVTRMHYVCTAICTPQCLNSSTYCFVCMYTAVCTPQCLNGGNCTEPGVCNCTMEWMGDHCEQGINLYTHIQKILPEVFYIGMNNTECALLDHVHHFNLFLTVPVHVSPVA